MACLAPLGCADGAARAPVVAYENGLWFTGADFEARTMYVQGSTFVPPEARPDSVVDLDGGYVVAPFGEAHNHNAEPADWEEVCNAYLRAGVFYILNSNNLPQARDRLAPRLEEPGTPDVLFANGGITGPGGHPIGVVQANVARGVWTEDEGEGAFLFSVSDAGDLDEVWPRLLATRPDIVKVYLLYSEEYEARLADEGTVGWRGLDPRLVPDVVSRARDAGLRVVAHVESAPDFRTAVDAGVDLVGHMPGFRGNEEAALPDPSRYEIAPEDAARAAEKGIVVVSTLAGLAEYASERGDAELRAAADRLNTANLRTLREAGVEIAVGSDMYDDTSVREAL